jgi:chloramphenicol 3-O-phosphotransferase
MATPGPGAGHAVLLMTGIQAAGKSTVAQLLAERLPRSVHVRGDTFRRMVVGGRADMTPDPSAEALRQLSLRHRLAANVSDAYFEAGFTVITQDVILGAHLAEMTTLIRSRPLLVVVLAPSAAAIAERERARGKTAYGTWAVGQLDDMLRRETPRLGLWLDTSRQTAAQTADEILSRAWAEAAVAPQRSTASRPVPRRTWGQGS